MGIEPFWACVAGCGKKEATNGTSRGQETPGTEYGQGEKGVGGVGDTGPATMPPAYGDTSPGTGTYDASGAGPGGAGDTGIDSLRYLMDGNPGY